MGVVPFSMEDDLTAALNALKGASIAAVEIILDTVNEKLMLGPLPSDASLAAVHEVNHKATIIFNMTE
jgi:hypothetical protein